MSQNTKYWLCQLFGWGAFGLINILFVAFSDKASVEGVLGNLLFIALGLIITHCFRLIIHKYDWKQLPLEKLIPRVLLLILCGDIMLTSITSLYEYFFEPKDYKNILVLIYFINIFIMLFAWCLAYFIWTFVVRNRRLQIEKLQMEAAVKNVELKNIKANLQPHFIFNSLNSIRSLVTENPDKARTAITQLSNILRSSITANKTELVPLSREIEIVQDYLSLEKIRFEERLKLQYNIAPQTLDFLIPNLLIQTIVENAIKHGIGKSETGGDIFIEAYTDENNIYISVKNTGQLNSNVNTDSNGFGIASSLIRLQYHFGENAKITLQNNSNNLVQTLITIPIKND